MSHFWGGVSNGLLPPLTLGGEGGTGKGRLDRRAPLPDPGVQSQARDPAAARPEGGAPSLGAPRPEGGAPSPGPGPRPSAAPEAGTIARTGGAGRGRGAPPGPAPGPPPALAHPLAHWLPPAARPGTARGSRRRRRRARHGRPPVPLGARGGRAARGRAGRPGAPGLLPLRQGRRGPGVGAEAGAACPRLRTPRRGGSVPGWSAGQESPGGSGPGTLGDPRGEVPAVPVRGDPHASAPPTGTCHSHRDPRRYPHALSYSVHRQKSPRQSLTRWHSDTLAYVPLTASHSFAG